MLIKREKANKIILYLIEGLVGMMVLTIYYYGAYCERHRDETNAKDKEYWDKVVQDAYYNCKFEGE